MHCRRLFLLAGQSTASGGACEQAAIRITVFYGPTALGAKGLVAASRPMVVASTL
jgi:hypothetical protein